MAQLGRSRVARLIGLGCLAILLIVPGILSAQSVTGSIAGTVVDQTSQALPGAVVILEASETGLTRELTTGEDGSFIFAARSASRTMKSMQRSSSVIAEPPRVPEPAQLGDVPPEEE